MSRVAYVNRSYIRCLEAAEMDYPVADEVCVTVGLDGGEFVDEAAQFDRLGAALAERGLAWPTTRRVLSLLLQEMARRNRMRDGAVTIQVSRGIASGDPAPADAALPLLAMLATRGKPEDETAEIR